MRSCKDTARILSDSRDEPLPFMTRMGLRMHLMMCRFCRRYDHQLNVLDAVVEGYASSAEDLHSAHLSPEVRDRIKESLTD
jgi:hypothetical protein